MFGAKLVEVEVFIERRRGHTQLVHVGDNQHVLYGRERLIVYNHQSEIKKYNQCSMTNLFKRDTVLVFNNNINTKFNNTGCIR